MRVINEQFLNVQYIYIVAHADINRHDNGCSSADYHAVCLVMADTLGD